MDRMFFGTYENAVSELFSNILTNKFPQLLDKYMEQWPHIIDAIDIDKNTLLMIACKKTIIGINNKLYNIIYLLKNDANPNLVNKSGNSALKYYMLYSMNFYSIQDNITILKEFIKSGLDTKYTDNHGSNYLFYTRIPEIILMLLQAGCNPNQISKDNYTPLFESITNVHSLKLLLDAGANPNIKNNRGETVLMEASLYGHTDAVRLLLRYSTDLFIKNKYNMTALDLAIDASFIFKNNTNREYLENNKHIIKLLSEEMAVKLVMPVLAEKTKLPKALSKQLKNMLLY